MTRRVVVTGMGTVNSLASDLRQFWQGLCHGRSGVGPI
jgi:3-oxoacyl-[acyl-carrier-protein] synthase II